MWFGCGVKIIISFDVNGCCGLILCWFDEDDWFVVVLENVVVVVC